MPQTAACPSCRGTVSPRAFDCPHCGHPLRKPRRGLFGTLFKWLFIGWNVLMLIAVVSGLGSVGQDMDGAASDMERDAMAAGAGLGMAFLLMVWAAGDVVLGLLVLLTRPSK
jgi:hypothetical protein